MIFLARIELYFSYEHIQLNSSLDKMKCNIVVVRIFFFFMNKVYFSSD